MEDGRPRPSPQVLLLLTPQIKDFLHLFAVVGEHPLFGVVVCVRHLDNQAMHVRGVGSGKIGGIEKGKSERLAVG